MHLKSIGRRGGEDADFPFTVPAIRSLDQLRLDSTVTFFVGENGSGKSTLLEGIAAAARLPAVGSADVPRDETLEAQRRLGKSAATQLEQESDPRILRARRGFLWLHEAAGARARRAADGDEG